MSRNFFATSPAPSTATARVSRAFSQLLALACTLFVTACPEPLPQDMPPGTASTEVKVSALNNWSIVTKLMLPTIDVAANADVEFCWDSVVKEVRCQPFDASVIKRATFVRTDALNHTEANTRLELGTFTQSDAAEYFYVNTAAGVKCAKFSEMKNLKDAPFVAATHNQEKPDSTYFITVNDTNDPGYGTRALAYVNPKAGAPDKIQLPADMCSGILDFSATFGTALSVPGTGSLTVDWSEIAVLKTNGTDVAVPGSAATAVTLQLGFFAAKTAEDVRADVLHLENNATRLWSKTSMGPKKTTLDDLTERGTNAAFSTLGGFAAAGTGTWVLAISSKKTQNPAPISVVVLQPQ